MYAQGRIYDVVMAVDSDVACRKGHFPERGDQ